jgi:hypothetical protein
MQSIMMSSTAGSNIPTGAIEVKRQSKEIPPPLGYVTPPHFVLMSNDHCLTNLVSLRLKRNRSNSYDSAIYHPLVRSSSKGGGRRLLLNVDSIETSASFPPTLDLRDTSENEFILATPNLLMMEIQHPTTAIATSRCFSNADTLMSSKDEILSENSRYVSLSGMFLPVHENTPREDDTVILGRFGLRLKPRTLTVRHRHFNSAGI